MHANDAVLLSCPGTDLARSAADFHLDGDHLYVGSASTDPARAIVQVAKLQDVSGGFAFEACNECTSSASAET